MVHHGYELILGAGVGRRSPAAENEDAFASIGGHLIKSKIPIT